MAIMRSKKPYVLAVDDDVGMQHMVRRLLELEGYRVLVAGDGEAALNMLVEEAPDLLLLDIIMPDVDGYTVCHDIREFSQVPIIMITAKSEDEEKVKGLDAGADDYITKPFSSKELVARVKAVLRRTSLQNECLGPTFCAGELVVEFTKHRVSLEKREVNLTPREYSLLCYLAHNAGRILTLDQILNKVWGEEYSGEAHLLQVYIARLRKKLRDNARNPRYISNKPGIGYMLIDER